MKTNYLGLFSGSTFGDMLAELSSPDPSRQTVFGINRGREHQPDHRRHEQHDDRRRDLTGTEQDLRGWFWTTQAGASMVFTAVTPNSSAPDRMCAADGNGAIHSNLPEANLPCAYASLGNTTAGVRSRHPNGVGVLLCDGSVQFVSDSVDIRVWHALGTIRGSELFDSPW